MAKNKSKVIPQRIIADHSKDLNVCELTSAECDRLEVLRMKLWNNTFEVQSKSGVISGLISEVLDIIKSKPVRYKKHLESMKNMADFLSEKEGWSEMELKDAIDNKTYTRLGFYNNIIHDITEKCQCDKLKRVK